MRAEEDAYNSLCAYTLARGDAAFIHQHVVDAYAAQRADQGTRPVKIAFALVGLYLLIERRFTGRQVQLVHMRLGHFKHEWPRFLLPEHRGALTAVEVMAAREGSERDAAIHSWCASVWASYAGHREAVADLLRGHGII